MQRELFRPLDDGLRAALRDIPDLVDTLFPLPGRFKAGLPGDVRTLSHLLTDERDSRKDGYLGKDALHSAYLRYFLPWNIYRLSRLLPQLPLALNDGDVVVDVGSGPLTLPIALLLSRPDLRNLSLEIRCVDRTPKILDAGAQLFETLREALPCNWRIKTVRASFGDRQFAMNRPEVQKARLVCAANLLNELSRDRTVSPEVRVRRNAEILASLGNEKASILIVEPGTPPSARDLAALRAQLISSAWRPASPCPHAGPCPLPGGKGKKWCHFAFDDSGAPQSLRQLSAAAGIPKERVSLSFLLMTRDPSLALAPKAASGELVRVVSDGFAVPGQGWGRYGCSKAGLVLVAGHKLAVDKLASGCLVRLPPSTGERDARSGAWIIRI